MKKIYEELVIDFILSAPEDVLTVSKPVVDDFNEDWITFEEGGGVE